ncbi:hypothetical protein [Dyadobacter sp.]|uniref:hypothetical protein n=1 Tax=Dyadobacter sp. TaxID=1914288 RepID=UPI003F6F0BB0
MLLGLLLYNMVGYSIVYLLEERHEIGAVNTDLIQQSASSADIVIKVPVAVPYQTNWETPESVEGQIRHEGRFYQMKSQQLLNDTMYVHCELDQTARDRFTDLVSKINDQVTGQSDNAKDQHSSILKNFLKEYMGQDRKHVFYVLEWTPSHLIISSSTPAFTTERHASIPAPPPDRA